MRLVREFLEEQGCPLTDLIMTMLDIILRLNSCRTEFSDQLWRQICGFPTGVACGAEVADI